MKKTLFLAYVAVLLSFLPSLLGPDRLAADPAPSPAPSDVPAAAAAPASSPPPAAAPHTLQVLIDGQSVTMDMQEYLFGVVAAEMPAAFCPEALKAQAVAARSYALYCAAAHKHADADVCTDFHCCQAWKPEAALREGWGADYEVYAQKLREAVAATAGQVLRYQGQPVFAAFHASSAGATEDCGEIWNAQPYLISVPSPESAETVPNYVSSLSCTPLDFRDTVLSVYPDADFSGPEAAWIGAVSRDESGRVAAVTLGGVEIPGTRLRSLFSLRSTAFTLEYADGCFLFTVTGSGHGVGMSQYGANVMAARGADYTQILAHYYPGTELCT